MEFSKGHVVRGKWYIGFIDGSIPCPEKFDETHSEDGNADNAQTIFYAYKVWKIHNKALMTLLATTLSSPALSCIIGCRISKEMWTDLRQWFASKNRTSIV